MKDGQLITIRPEEYKKILGNERVCLDKITELQGDFHALMESLANLYEQDYKVFALLGVSVEATLKMKGQELCSCHIGTSDIPKEETDDGQANKS